MEKDLSQRMAEKAAGKNKNNARFNLAVFLLLRDEIYKAIDDGWSVKYVWEVLYEEEKIRFSYQTFLNLVNKHKTDRPKNLKGDAYKEKPNELVESESKIENKEVVDKSSEIESESSEDRIKITDLSNDTKEDYGNPKGFEWSTDYDPKDFI